MVGPEFGHAARITKDLALSSRLLAELCARYELEAPACVSDESKSDTLRLDLNLTCLRKVFSLCYYCGNACANSPDLYKQCGDLHLRSPPSPETIEDWDRLSSWLDVKVEDLIRFYGHPFELASEDK